MIRPFDPLEYFAKPQADWDGIEDFADSAKITLTADWERVLPVVQRDPDARRDWSWLVLPLRFGFPATPSPAAGLSAHSDMGNVAVVGPAWNDGWNRIGDSAGYQSYDLVEQSWAAPLGLTDSFFPRLGFLNAPILYFLIKPPLDLAWRTAGLPIRAAVGSRQPSFLPASAPAVRSVSFEAGPAVTDLHDDFVALFFSREQFPELVVAMALAALPDEIAGTRSQFTWVTSPAYRLKNVSVDGVPISQPDSPTYRPTSGWSSLGFNETVLGGGVDWNNVRLGRTFLGIKASYTFLHHGLGFEKLADVEDFPSIGTELAGSIFSVWRQQARILVTVGF